MVGISVRESRYEASIANTTASASGENSDPTTPPSAKIGTNTMQIESVETNAGTAIWSAPSTIASYRGFPCSRFLWMFSIATGGGIFFKPGHSAYAYDGPIFRREHEK